MTVNKVILVGNLGKDPEIRQTNSGMAVGNLRLATTDRRKSGDSWEDHTEWHTVTCFGKTAENVGRFCQKGKQLYVEGRIQTRKWEDKEGKDRWSTEVVADVVRFLGGKSEGGGKSYDDGKPAGTSNAAPSGGASDDIPF